MIEQHKTNIMSMSCRICAVTAPKEDIRNMIKLETDWLGLDQSCGHKICRDCGSKIRMYR